ncbi:MAG: leucine-rich repeat domain-containing protein [Bacteroidota bacterium]
MKRHVLSSLLILSAFASAAQNDRSKKVETKYLSLPGYDISVTDPSTVTIEFAMKDGVFGTEKVKEGESICKPTGGTVKDAVKVKSFYIEVPYTQQESYVVAKGPDGKIVYSEKSSETGQSLVRFGWDEKMKQAKCEYALVPDKVKKDFAGQEASFKSNEHKKYENEVYGKAVADATARVSLSYMTEEFEVYSAKGKGNNYDELETAFDKAMAAYSSIKKNGFNNADLGKLKEAISVWEKELLTADLENKDARISKDIAKGLHENCARAYMYLYDFDNAKKHCEEFLKLYGNFSNNRSQAIDKLLKQIYIQKMGAEKNKALISDIAALHTKASAKGATPKSKLLPGSEFSRLQSEFYSFKGTQSSALMQDKKNDVVTDPSANPYQKWYYPTAVGGEGIIMNMPPSALSGIPELKAFPVEICLYTGAKQVVILKNKISSVPADIGKMQSLEKLDLSGNQLTTLPAQIGQLENLEKLILDNNPIESLPKELGNCKKLKSLSLKGTKLTDAQIAEIQKMLPECKIKS